MLMLISSIETQSCFHIIFSSVPIFSTDRININGVNGTGTNLKRITNPMLIPKKYKINLPINFKILRIILHKKRDVNILPFLFFCSFIFYHFYIKRNRFYGNDNNINILFVMPLIDTVTAYK